MALVENPSEFFDDGETATILGQPVAGILDTEYADVEGVGVEQVIFICSAADVVDVVDGNTVDFVNKSYQVRHIRRDGNFATMILGDV